MLDVKDGMLVLESDFAISHNQIPVFRKSYFRLTLHIWVRRN